MANPRRSTFQFHQQQPPIIPISDQTQTQTQPSSLPISLSSLVVFLKRPHAFPFLLSIFVLLTWLSLRLQHPASSLTRSPLSSSSSRSQAHTQKGDIEANLVRFSAIQVPSLIAKDHRGWLLDPIIAAQEAGIHGGAHSCASLHVGEIRPGGVRGNHRHHTCNETFIIWGAETKFRLENPGVEDKGYGEVSIGVDEVAIAASLAGTAHALINVDRVRPTFFLGCQDNLMEQNSSTTDYKVWKDI